MLPVLTLEELALRLVLAGVLGGLIGFEREVRDHEAGLRTHLLVAVGSSLFTIVSAYGFADFFDGNAAIRADPSRIAAQIVAGVGFLGAGAIFRQGALVRGLTTAATLWAVAAIGLAVGAGLYAAGAVGTAVVLVSLGPLKRLARSLRPAEAIACVSAQLPKDAPVDQLATTLRAIGISSEGIAFREAGPTLVGLVVVVTLPSRQEGLLASVTALLAMTGAETVTTEHICQQTAGIVDAKLASR